MFHLTRKDEEGYKKDDQGDKWTENGKGGK